MITLICGLPNAGKTTYSHRYANVIHYDDVIAPKGMHPLQVLCEMVSDVDDVCVEGVFITSHERKRIAQAYSGTQKVCIWLNTPLEECIKRENRNRATCLINSCNALFQPPTYSEGWDEIIVIGENNA